MFKIITILQDKNGTIENEELNGFLKDLTELVQQVTFLRRYQCTHTIPFQHNLWTWKGIEVNKLSSWHHAIPCKLYKCSAQKKINKY